MKFPTAKGSNLQRKKLSLPQDFDGELNIVLIAFERWQQNTVDTWLPYPKNLNAPISKIRVLLEISSPY